MENKYFLYRICYHYLVKLFLINNLNNLRIICLVTFLNIYKINKKEQLFCKDCLKYHKNIQMWLKSIWNYFYYRLEKYVYRHIIKNSVTYNYNRLKRTIL